jgi:threonine synthase
MQALAAGHRFEVPQSVHDKILANFGFACTPEEACFAEIGETFRSVHYLLDPHTAVATAAARKASSGPCVVLSTANPYKFSPTVLAAVGGKSTGDDFVDLATLEELTGITAPAALRALRQQPVRFNRVIQTTEIETIARTL